MTTPAIGVGWDLRRALAFVTALAVAASLFMLYTGTAQAVQSGDPCYEEVAVTQYRYEKQVKVRQGDWVRAPEQLQFMGADEWSDDPIDITDRPGGPWTLGVPKQLGNDWYKYVELTREDLRQAEVPCQDNPGHCPAGFDKYELPDARVKGKTFTADVDYDVVILVGGPPNDNNQDPDGRNKYFYDVEAGKSVSREAHDISHVCYRLATTTTTTQPTTTTSQPTTTTTQPTTTTTEATTTTTVAETTTTTVAETTTTTEAETTTTVDEPEDDPEVLPTVVTTTPDEVDDEELPFTGLDSDIMFAISVVLLGLGAALLAMTRRLGDDS